MRLFKKKKRIPDDKYRVIKIGKDALYELIRESIIDNAENHFDISDVTSIVTFFDIDWDKGEFICLARNEKGENEHLQCDVDTELLLSKLQDTTTSLYNGVSYIELSKEDIDKL